MRGRFTIGGVSAYICQDCHCCVRLAHESVTVLAFMTRVKPGLNSLANAPFSSDVCGTASTRKPPRLAAPRKINCHTTNRPSSRCCQFGAKGNVPGIASAAIGAAAGAAGGGKPGSRNQRAQGSRGKYRTNMYQSKPPS